MLKEMEKRVDKLLKAHFIKEVMHSTWLVNVVMVKKANDQWRMCIDYTDLNKAVGSSGLRIIKKGGLN